MSIAMTGAGRRRGKGEVTVEAGRSTDEEQEQTVWVRIALVE